MLSKRDIQRKERIKKRNSERNKREANKIFEIIEKKVDESDKNFYKLKVNWSYDVHNILLELIKKYDYSYILQPRECNHHFICKGCTINKWCLDCGSIIDDKYCNSCGRINIDLQFNCYHDCAVNPSKCNIVYEFLVYDPISEDNKYYMD